MRGLLDPRRRSPRVLFAVVHLVTSAALAALAFLAIITALGPHPVASKPAPAGDFWALALTALPILAVRLVFEARRLSDIGVHPAWCLAARIPFVVLVALLFGASLEQPMYDAVVSIGGPLVQGIEVVGFLVLALIPGDREGNASGLPPSRPWKLGARAPIPA